MSEVNYEQIKESADKLGTVTLEYLKWCFRKSGIRGCDCAPSVVAFAVGGKPTQSVFLGEYITPDDENLNGTIMLHLDAIVSLAEFMGVDYLSLAAKVFFCQIHNMLSWGSKGKFDFLKSEGFASSVCKKLLHQGIVTDVRLKIYIDKADKLTILARQKWIEKWTGLPLDEVIADLEGVGDSDVPEGNDLPEGVCSGTELATDLTCAQCSNVPTQGTEA